jgi:hypothetical protein
VELTVKDILDSLITKTPAELIDALITTNLKIFYFMEIETDESKPEHDRFKAGQTVIALNKKRSNLIAGLDSLLGYSKDVNPKTY